MLRKRVAGRDDRAIYRLVDELLIPFARDTKPDLKFSMPILRERLKPCTTYVYAAGSRMPSAFISFRAGRDVMLVEMLAVAAREQGRGIGSRLLALAEHRARKLRCREMRLWVDEANTPAQQFYRSRGYEPVYYEQSVRCYLMSKPIAGRQRQQAPPR